MADDRFWELLVLYVLGELEVEEECPLERHAERCPRCKRELEGLWETDAILRRWAASTRKSPP